MEGHGGGESGPSDTASIRGSMSSVTWVSVGEITVEVHGLHVYGVSLGTGPRAGGAISWDSPGCGMGDSVAAKLGSGTLPMLAVTFNCIS